jgi:hypothetical protein
MSTTLILQHSPYGEKLCSQLCWPTTLDLWWADQSLVAKLSLAASLVLLPCVPGGARRLCSFPKPRPLPVVLAPSLACLWAMNSTPRPTASSLGLLSRSVRVYLGTPLLRVSSLEYRSAGRRFITCQSLRLRSLGSLSGFNTYS